MLVKEVSQRRFQKILFLNVALPIPAGHEHPIDQLLIKPRAVDVNQELFLNPREINRMSTEKIIRQCAMRLPVDSVDDRLSRAHPARNFCILFEQTNASMNHPTLWDV